MAFPRLGGTGLPLNINGGLGSQLPFPNTAFPASFTPGVAPTNFVSLAAGQSFVVPSGTFLVIPGGNTSLQFLDPATSKWTTINGDNGYQPFHLDSDGTNVRLANLTGCPIGALVTNAGTGYTNGIGTAATGLTITPSAGGSVWVPVVGGSINSTIAITAGGTGYTFPPNIIIQAPPLGGIQASAVCTVSAGAINTVTVINQGAGYTSAPTITLQNDYRDTTGKGGILTANATLTGSGSLLAMYPNPAQGVSGYGTPLTAVPTFTFSPASTTAATAVMNFAATGLTVTGGGTAVPAGSIGLAAPTLVPGTAAANTAGPISAPGLSFPRAAWFFLNISGGVVQGSGNVVTDPGIFQAVPTFGLVSSTGVAPTAGVNITVTVGGINDISYIQPF